MSDPGSPVSDPIGILEIRLEEAQRRLVELREAVAARDNFIAVAAHELRNPMTPILGQIELLLWGLKSSKYSPVQIEDRLARIQRSVGHYLKRAAILLDVSRIASGKFKMSPSPCDLSEIIRFIVDSFDEMAGHAGANLQVQIPETLTGSWDRVALEQIIDNLISNAIKYGGKNTVVVSAEEQNGSEVVIKVRDYGPGISSRDRERIFGRFERAVGTEEQQTGFGVGLWVVGQIIDTMDGKITVDDAEGGGTVFAVTVPRYLGTGSYE